MTNLIHKLQRQAGGCWRPPRKLKYFKVQSFNLHLSVYRNAKVAFSDPQQYISNRKIYRNQISNCNPNSILRRKSPPKPFPSEYLPRGNLIYQPDCTINIHSGSFLRIPMFYSCETKQGFEKVSMLTIVLKAGASILCRTDRQKCLILFQTQNFLYQNENLASEFTLVTI